MARRLMNGSATWRTSIAVCTRVLTPRFSRASWRASALMIVASMPIRSPVTRSSPCSVAAMPRMMLPPPITTAVSTPSSCTSASCADSVGSTSGAIPKGWLPISTSPDSLMTTRR
jgi:hypothetical protein